jgi:hypothetical protein
MNNQNSEKKTPFEKALKSGSNSAETNELAGNVSGATNYSQEFLNKSDYEAVYEKFSAVEEEGNDFEVLIRDNLIEEIKKNLETHGIAFIAGPILVGKTVLLKIFRKISALPSCISIEIPSAELNVKKSEINSTRTLYYQWYCSIADQIRNHMSASKGQAVSFPQDVLLRKKNFDSFEAVLGDRKSAPANDFLMFLIMLDQLKVGMRFEGDVTVMLSLDDIHSYVDTNVFFVLKRELVGLPDRFSEEHTFSIRVLFASRYLPSALGRKQWVIPIPNFPKATIVQLATCLSTDISERVKDEFNDLVYEKTEGYPWFVVRFFMIYAMKRIKADKTPALNLATHIFEHEDYWTSDSLFDSNKTSDFLNKLYLLVPDRNEKDDEKYSEFRKFLSLPPSNGTPVEPINPNDFIIRQSGFINTTDHSDLFEESGCEILKNYFKPAVAKQFE